MTALSADFNRAHAGLLGPMQPVPVDDGAVIYVGSLVALKTDGTAVPAADTSGYKVVGVSQDALDNTAGLVGQLGSAPARYVRVQGGIWSFIVAGSPVAGAAVFVTDDNTLTTTPTNVPCGECWEPDPESTSRWFVLLRANALPLPGATQADSIVTLTDSTGDSGTHNDTLADGSTIGAALTDNSTGSAGDTIAAGAGVSTVTIPLTSLATGLSTAAIDLLTTYTPGYAFKLLSFDFVTTIAGTGAGASQTFNLEIGTTNVTGGSLNVTLASTDTIGKVTAGTAITAANTGTAADTLSIEMAASGTVFTAGSGYFVVKIQNMDTANAVASLAAKINTLRTDNLVQNQNDSDLAQKVMEIIAALDTAGVTA